MADDHRNQPKAEHIEWFLTFAFGNRIALTVAERERSVFLLTKKMLHEILNNFG